MKNKRSEKKVAGEYDTRRIVLMVFKATFNEECAERKVHRKK